MLAYCPQCQTAALPGRFTCAKCGYELQEQGLQMESLTYWSDTKPRRTMKYTATVLIGLGFTIVFHHIVPCVVALAAAALMYVKDYK